MNEPEPLMPLLDQIKAALFAPVPRLDDDDAFAALQARGAEVRASMERRARAGVRVHASADDLDERRVQTLAVLARMQNNYAVSLSTKVQTLSGLLLRAHQALIDQALAAAPRDEEAEAAAARDAAEAAAAADRAEAKRRDAEARWNDPANAAYRAYINDLWERSHSPDPAIAAAARAEGAAGPAA